MFGLLAAGSSHARAVDEAAAVAPMATVGDVAVPRSDVETAIRQLHPQSPPSAEQRVQIEATVLEQLIEDELLRAALAGERVVVSDAELAAATEAARGQLASRGQTLEQFIAASGRGEAGFRERLRLEVGVEKYVRPRITPAAVDEFFSGSRRDFDGTRLRVRHILLRPDIVDTDGIDRRVAEADAIRNDILQGRITFEDAARRFSAGPSRHDGGDIGWVARRGPMVDAFNKPVFDLAKGEVSKPIVTPFGVHLVKVTDVEPGRAGLAAVRTQVERSLSAKLVRELVAGIRDTVPVRYLPGVAHFDPATPRDGDQPRRIIVEPGP